MIYKVAIIGCGNIGYRHLQGLAKSVNNLDIYVVESNQDILTNLSKSDSILLRSKYLSVAGFLSISNSLNCF